MLLSTLPWVQCKLANPSCRTVTQQPTSSSKEDSDCIYVDNDTRIQIMDTMAFLPRADKEQCAAFIVRLSHELDGSLGCADRDACSVTSG